MTNRERARLRKLANAMDGADIAAAGGPLLALDWMEERTRCLTGAAKLEFDDGGVQFDYLGVTASCTIDESAEIALCRWVGAADDEFAPYRNGQL